MKILRAFIISSQIKFGHKCTNLPWNNLWRQVDQKLMRADLLEDALRSPYNLIQILEFYSKEVLNSQNHKDPAVQAHWSWCRRPCVAVCEPFLWHEGRAETMLYLVKIDFNYRPITLSASFNSAIWIVNRLFKVPT